MTDLAHFLLARIAEDEQRAQRAARLTPVHDPRGWRWQQSAHDPLLVEAVMPTGTALPLARANSYAVHAAFIARYGPARVLAECDAKRRIVEDLRDELANQHDPEPTTLQLADRTLLALALPYADHPDYREEWRP